MNRDKKILMVKLIIQKKKKKKNSRYCNCLVSSSPRKVGQFNF
jgi:hypothetical protein